MTEQEITCRHTLDGGKEQNGGGGRRNTGRQEAGIEGEEGLGSLNCTDAKSAFFLLARHDHIICESSHVSLFFSVIPSKAQ